MTITKETISKPAPPSSKVYRNFGVVLYPDRLEHMDMLKYLEGHPYQFQIVYILHDRDVWDDDNDEHKKGDPKEHHYHVAIHCKNPKSLSAFLKFFHVWIDYAEPLSSMDAYILYMLHDTPDSMHKASYAAEELKGDKGLMRNAVQNARFVQLSDIIEVVDSTDGSMKELLRWAVNSQDTSVMDAIKSYQSLISTMSNQEFRRHLAEENIITQKVGKVNENN